MSLRAAGGSAPSRSPDPGPPSFISLSRSAIPETRLLATPWSWIPPLTPPVIVGMALLPDEPIVLAVGSNLGTIGATGAGAAIVGAPATGLAAAAAAAGVVPRLSD